jgi:hypothetical protein
VRKYIVQQIERLARIFARVAAEQYSSRSQYLALSVLARRYGYTTLSAAELKVFSQNGEDGVLSEIFSRIGTTNNFFVEFGVADGVECNTRFLMEVLGWSGVYFEPSPRAFGRLSERLANRKDVLTIQSFVTPENVGALFAQACVPPEPDLLSIDIDGQDYWVWEALEGFQPRVVVVEYNATIVGSRLVETKAKAKADDGRIREMSYRGLSGASLEALRSLGDKKGYKLVYSELAGVNLFFVRNDLAGPFEEMPLARGANFDLVGRKHNIDPGDYVEV